jgi:hypothetical protein
VYALLITDLIILYEGYKGDDGVGVKGLSVKGVCKKVKEELGIVVIRSASRCFHYVYEVSGPIVFHSFIITC